MKKQRFKKNQTKVDEKEQQVVINSTQSQIVSNNASQKKSTGENESDTEKLSFTEELKRTPLLHKNAYENLPIILRDAVEPFEGREKDIVLLSSIAILSGTMPNVFGIYAHNIVNANLNVFVVAPPASGKSVMKFARVLGSKIHSEKRDKSKADIEQYEKENIEKETSENTDSNEQIKTKNEFKKKAKQELLFVPGNSSSASIISVLNQNRDGCILCETEADTLSNALKQDWGSFSDIIRKAFHHETISYSRKLNSELIEIEKPKLSILLTSTPRQVEELIKDAENGLFSRFLFYAFQPKLVWKDVFANKEKNVEGIFERLSAKVINNYKEINSLQFEFSLTSKQEEIFNNIFKKVLNQYSKLTEGDSPSFIYRFGLIFFRIAMILTCYRKFQNNEINEGNFVTCNEDDFKTASAIISTCLKHNLLMYEYLSKKVSNDTETNNESSLGIHRFLDKIEYSKVYKRNELIVIGTQMNLSERTVGNYLKKLTKLELLSNKNYGFYEKVK